MNTENKSPFSRGGSMWIVGRLGILIVFGILPLMRSCEKVKTEPLQRAFDEASDKFFAAYKEADKYPVLSDGWNTNKEIGDRWLSEQHRLYVKMYGTNQ